MEWARCRENVDMSELSRSRFWAQGNTNLYFGGSGERRPDMKEKHISFVNHQNIIMHVAAREMSGCLSNGNRSAQWPSHCSS